MAPDPATPASDAAQSNTDTSRLLGAMSVLTMLMTVAQVLTIWVGHQAAGISDVSWGAYVFAAILWLSAHRHYRAFHAEPARHPARCC